MRDAIQLSVDVEQALTNGDVIFGVVGRGQRGQCQRLAVCRCLTGGRGKAHLDHVHDKKAGDVREENEVETEDLPQDELRWFHAGWWQSEMLKDFEEDDGGLCELLTAKCTLIERAEKWKRRRGCKVEERVVDIDDSAS